MRQFTQRGSRNNFTCCLQQSRSVKVVRVQVPWMFLPGSIGSLTLVPGSVDSKMVKFNRSQFTCRHSNWGGNCKIVLVHILLIYTAASHQVDSRWYWVNSNVKDGSMRLPLEPVMVNGELFYRNWGCCKCWHRVWQLFLLEWCHIWVFFHQCYKVPYFQHLELVYSYVTSLLSPTSEKVQSWAQNGKRHEKVTLAFFMRGS